MLFLPKCHVKRREAGESEVKTDVVNKNPEINFLSISYKNFRSHDLAILVSELQKCLRVFLSSSCVFPILAQ
jgi:hypothetical protein